MAPNARYALQTKNAASGLRVKRPQTQQMTFDLHHEVSQQSGELLDIPLKQWIRPKQVTLRNKKAQAIEGLALEFFAPASTLIPLAQYATMAGLRTFRPMTQLYHPTCTVLPNGEITADINGSHMLVQGVPLMASAGNWRWNAAQDTVVPDAQGDVRLLNMDYLAYSEYMLLKEQGWYSLRFSQAICIPPRWHLRIRLLNECPHDVQFTLNFKYNVLHG